MGYSSPFWAFSHLAFVSARFAGHTDHTLPCRSVSSVLISGKVWLLVFVLVLFRHIVLRNFARPDFALVSVGSVFHAAHRFGFHVLAFFHQLFHAFRIVIASACEPLRVAGLAARLRPQTST